MDWNNDGKKDLILGEYSGTIRIYLNTNLDENPIFHGFSYLKVGAINFDCGSYSTPHVVDWNNDGRKDVLCGESNGKVWLLLNTGTDAHPVFSSSEYLQDGAGNLTVVYRSAPTVVDWNGDGKKDLISGEINGTLYYFENRGTDEAPAFQGKKKLMIGNSTLDVGYTSRPDMVDWDNDGTPDIISGEYSGSVTCYLAHGALSLSANSISQATGGSIDFRLKAGRNAAGRNYFILGSLSGTEPGLPLPGGLVTLPLNWDSFTDLVIGLANSQVLVDFHGVLDGQGNGAAVLNTLGPVPPSAVGGILYFAYLLYYPGIYYPYDYVSNPVSIEIVP